MSGIQKFALLCIVTAGMLLRFWGLSHDLHENNIYHPDTSKQVRAAERFLNGNYYYHIGILDYDAYPYFNPHLVEYICRATALVKETACSIAGVPFSPEVPDMITLFWITRILNALLATALILLVFQIGRENFSTRAALIAALLTAVSPVDMIACHFAGAETTSCFFTVLALLYAFRIYRNGRTLDYVLAGLFTAFAFASKYHAAMVIVPVLLAHYLRTGSLKELISGASLGRLTVLTLAGIAACFLAIPTLAGHFQESVMDIIHFFTQISSGRGMDADVRSSGKLAKFMFSMKRNIPILLTILGPLVCLGVLAEAFDTIRRRNPLKLILFSLPCVYFLVGVSMRPMASPVYHTLMTPMVFIIAALFFAEWNPSRLVQRPWVRNLLGFAVALSAGYLLYVSARQAFFFWHQDTSRAVQAWIKENTPPTYNVIPGGYTFSAEERRDQTVPANGTILAESNLQGLDKPSTATHMKNFSLETLSLAIFINTTIDLYRDNTEGLTKSPMLPPFPRCPSLTGNHFIFDNGPGFVRNEKLLHLQPREELTRWLVRSNTPERVWIHIRNGAVPNIIEFSFGHKSKRVNMEAASSTWFSFREPAANFPSKDNHIFYRFVAEAAHGPASVTIATKPEEFATALYEAGDCRGAAPLLTKAASETHNPALAANAIICDLISGTNLSLAADPEILASAKQLFSVTNSESMQQVFGVSLKYLDSLEYISIASNKLLADYSSSNCFASTRSLMLNPGHYTAYLQLHSSTNIPVEFSAPLKVISRTGRICQNQSVLVKLPPLGSNIVQVAFHITADTPEAALLLEMPPPSPVRLDNLAIKPDILRNVRARTAALKAIETRSPAAAANEPLAYAALIALGDITAKQADFAGASAFYASAGTARPELMEHAARISAIRTNLTPQQLEPFAGIIDTLNAKTSTVRNASEAVFDGGIRLLGYSLNSKPATPTVTLDLNLYWRPRKITTRLEEYGVFVHVLDEAERIVFQADHPLMNDLVLDRTDTYLKPHFNQYPVPAGLKSGKYQIRVGLFKPSTGKKVDIVSSTFDTHREEIILPVELNIPDGAKQ